MTNKIVVVGTGYVGLVTGVCLASSGNRVVCVDIDGEKIRALTDGQVPIYEPGLSEHLRRAQAEGNLGFSTNLAGALVNADIAFIAVGTPSDEDGSADLSAVFEVASQIGSLARGRLIVVDKSTVPVGTAARVREILASKNDMVRFAVLSNPEFLKEGDAVRDFFRPDRIVIGGDDSDEWARDALVALYRSFVRTADQIICMSTASAELTKYAANAMLATRISFMNELSHLCDEVGADVTDIRKGIGSDSRIGPAFLYAGPGYGGSCLLGHETVLVQTRDGQRLMRIDEAVTDNKPISVMAIDEHDLPIMADIARVSARPYDGVIQQIRTKMGRRVSCTADHPFVVFDKTGMSRRVVLAKDVTEEDWLPVLLGAPLRYVSDPPSVRTWDVVDKQDVIVRLADDVDIAPLRQVVSPLSRFHNITRNRVCRLDEALTAGVQINGAAFGTCSNGTYVPGEIVLDEKFWRTIGLFVAEGWVSSDGRRMRVSWALNKNTEQALAREIADYWRAMGVKADVRDMPTAVMVSISSRILAKWLLETIGTGKDSYDVRVPDALWTASRSCKEAFLSGAWEGDGGWEILSRTRADGTIHPSGVSLTYGTVSPELADGIMRLLAELQLVASVEIRRCNKSTVDTYFITVSGADQIERAMFLIPTAERASARAAVACQTKTIKPTGYVRISDTLALVRVVENTPEAYQGNVYSIETVEEPHVFATTGNLIVHNCFPKDVRALLHTADEYAVNLRIVEAALVANNHQREVPYEILRRHFLRLEHTTIGIWGLAFKPETDDIREAPALHLIQQLIEDGATVSVYDPAALTPRNRTMLCEKHKKGPGVIDFASSAAEAARNADALVLMTEWREFRAVDLDEVGKTMHAKVIVDARNIWDPAACRRAGFAYYGIGRG